MSKDVNKAVVKDDQNILEVSHLKKYFPIKGGFFGGVTNNVKAVDDVSFTIKRGKTMGLAVHLARQCKPKDGARQLRRSIQQQVEGPLAEFLLRTARKVTKVYGALEDGQISFQVQR